jgi:hypothetical protein
VSTGELHPETLDLRSIILNLDRLSVTAGCAAIDLLTSWPRTCGDATRRSASASLGATASDVRLLVLMEGLRLTSVGGKIGLATATLASRLLGGPRFDVTSARPNGDGGNGSVARWCVDPGLLPARATGGARRSHGAPPSGLTIGRRIVDERHVD